MDKAAQGGGPLIDIGTHALDITLWCMGNYDIDSVSGSVFYKLGGLQQATEGNLFGPWDPETYEVEDSAVGFVKMKNGATIALEASWALNILESREASTTLCGTLAGAEIHSGMSHAKNELIYNRGRNGQLMEETLSPVGGVAYFGGGGEEGTIDCRQWLEAVQNGTEPLVKPEEALAGMNATINLMFGALYLLCLIPLYFYPLNEQKCAEIVESLDRKHSQAE